MNYRDLLKNSDWKLMFAVLFLIAAGLTGIVSTSTELFYKQFVWVAMGIFLVLVIMRFDPRAFANRRWAILGFYILINLLLVYTHFFGAAIRGAQSWIALGSFRVQPSEFSKLALILIFSLFFSRKHAAIARVSNIIISFLYFAIPAALILIEPDLGSALILFLIWLGFILISGVRWRHLFIVGLILAASVIFMWQGFLEDYQKERILGFLFPSRDVLGVNYSVLQAKIAVGSAGWLGKGFGQGTQTQLGFLTERQTDFIFSVLTEEWGMVAGIAVIAIFLFVVFEIVKIGFRSANNFSRFVCLGSAVLFSAQFVINVGSNLGLTPVSGVTFPFLSYGGSSLLTNLVLIGIIQSISIYRSL